MLKGMTDRDEFLAWVRTALYEAELALHNGDAGPRRALWSRNEPVSVLGAARNAYGQQEIDDLFTALGNSFSHCTSYAFDLQACDVAGDMAYTAGLEHTSVSVDGQPRTYTLRATQVYRRESGEWRVAHRHGDTAAGRRPPALRFSLIQGGGQGQQAEPAAAAGTIGPVPAHDVVERVTDLPERHDDQDHHDQRRGHLPPVAVEKVFDP